MIDFLVKLFVAVPAITIGVKLGLWLYDAHYPKTYGEQHPEKKR